MMHFISVNIHRISTVFLPCFNRISTVFSLSFHCASTVFLPCFHRVSLSGLMSTNIIGKLFFLNKKHAENQEEIYFSIKFQTDKTQYSDPNHDDLTRITLTRNRREHPIFYSSTTGTQRLNAYFTSLTNSIMASLYEKI